MKTFEAPEFVEIKMDAEIGSYQEDRDPTDAPFFAGPAPEAQDLRINER
jgi:hypothetical protein